MSTMTIPSDVTSQQVVEALREGLDSRYDVTPGMQIHKSPLRKPRPSAPGMIMVSAGAMARAQVTITPRSGRTDVRITPGGVLGSRLVNSIGIVREIRQALLSAPNLDADARPE